MTGKYSGWQTGCQWCGKQLAEVGQPPFGGSTGVCLRCYLEKVKYRRQPAKAAATEIRAVRLEKTSESFVPFSPEKVLQMSGRDEVVEDDIRHFVEDENLTAGNWRVLEWEVKERKK